MYLAWLLALESVMCPENPVTTPDWVFVLSSNLRAVIPKIIYLMIHFIFNVNVITVFT